MSSQGYKIKKNRTVQFGRRCFIAGLIVSITGCTNMIRRGQSPDDSMLKLTEEVPSTRYIVEACRVYGMNFAKIEGVGLVVDLNDTGSNPRPSGQRDYLKNELKSRGIDSVTGLISGKDTSMVVMKGYLPPAIRKGERFDVEIKTLPKTDTTSLEHGYLVETRMRPMALMGRSVKKGNVTGYVQGNVLTNSIFESRQDQPNQLRGWIYGGGVAKEDRPIGLTIRSDRSIRTSTSISRAINSRFTTITDNGRVGVATPKNDRIVELLVPKDYKHNIGRYIQVILNIAFNESAEKRINRLDHLDQLISDPAECRQAALRLEAFGSEGIPALKRALRHHDAEVKFQAAQALAYLGEADGVDILESAAKSEPAFRWHALTALATLEDPSAASSLSNLMHVESAETRYGAFRALRAKDKNDPRIRGLALDDFFFHVIKSEATPMLHIARSQRPELVCFGDNQTVADDLLFVKSGLTVKGDGNGRIKVTKFDTSGEQRKVCSTNIPELIRVLSDVGCDYSTMVKMFREFKQNDQLNTRLVVNAVPSIGKKSEMEEPLEKSERFISAPLPELFRTGDNSERKANRPETPVLTSANELKTGGQPKSNWSKIKGLLEWER